jgi:cation:H+ antiporter
MSLEVFLLLVGGLVLLVGGGEFLVRGASRFAEILGLSPLVVGLTVVAYGTSAPEMAVSIQAGLAGNDSIAVANVVGSNIFNVLFILGLCALVAPLVVDRRLVRVDVPVMIAVSLVAGLMALDRNFALWEGLVLTCGAAGYTAWSVISSRAETANANAANAHHVAEPELIAGKHPGWLVSQLAIAALGCIGWKLGWFGFTEGGLALAGGLVFALGHLFGKGGTTRAGDLVHQIGFILTGLGVLVLGAGWLVDGAVRTALSLGVSDAVVGLTIVAAGTSLPEVAASVIATIRGQRDLAIGNVVGSNIANILAILGVSSLVTPGGLSLADSMLRIDIPVMIAVAVVCLPVFYTGYLIRRWEGAVLLAAYVGYTTWLVFDATAQPASTALGQALAWVFAPVVLATFAVTGARALTTRHRDTPVA